MTDDPLVKAALAAQATGLAPHHLYRLASSGRVPCYRMGRAVRFSIPELREWMRQQATTATHGGEHVLATHA